MHTVKRIVLLALALSITAGLGCSHIGPGTVARDRFDYIGALSDSSKQQMLYNMVKMRYGEGPVFLEIASVISQYAIETDINVAATWQAPQGFNSNILALGATGRYLDRPTVTYSPLAGEKFARQLMRPIPPTAVMGLIEGGYSVDSVLRLCVNSINGIRNSYAGSTKQRPADPEFYMLIERLRKVQEAGVISLRTQKTGEMEGTAMVFRKKVDAPAMEDTQFIRKTLGLDPEAQEFKIVYGAVAKDDKELAILTRSIMQIIIDLAANIEVPATHVEEKRTNPTPPGETFQGVPVAALIKVHSSLDKPCDAVVAVQYRGYWFWIDDHDMRSKTFFSFLMLLFSLTETGGKENAPIITIPVS